MGTSKQLYDQIAHATTRLAQRKAREMLVAQREAARKQAADRREDTKRKLKLGGFVVEAGAEEMSGAEIIGALLSYREKVVATAEREQHRQLGAAHLAQQAGTRGEPRLH